MKGIVTINTDAGFFPMQKVGSYAYWIKADGLHLHGSGMFRDKCNNPTDAEYKAIINALHVLKCSGYIPIKKIIFNRDNINVESKKKGHDNQRKIYLLIRQLRKQSIKNKIIKGIYPFYEFRHVKAHNGTSDKRSWVNDWCHNQCSLRLKEWLIKNPF